MRTQQFIIQTKTTTDDGIGGKNTNWSPWGIVRGYIDMLTGGDDNPQNNAFVEESTHILILPEFTSGITDNMRVIDAMGRWYHITYSDDPVGQSHHNEIYLKYAGVI